MLVCSLKGIEIRVEALALDSPSSRIETAFRPCSASEKLRNIGARLVSLDPRDSYTMRMRKLEAIFFFSYCFWSYLRRQNPQLSTI